MARPQFSLMCQPDAQKVKVTNEELIFDLIYVFRYQCSRRAKPEGEILTGR